MLDGAPFPWREEMENKKKKDEKKNKSLKYTELNGNIFGIIS